MLAPWLLGASTSEDPSLSLNGREQNTSFVSSPSGGLPCGQSGACSQLQSVQSQTPASSPALHSEEPNFQITLIRPQPVPNRLHHIDLDPPPILLLFKLQAPILTVRPNRILPRRVPPSPTPSSLAQSASASSPPWPPSWLSVSYSRAAASVATP